MLSADWLSDCCMCDVSWVTFAIRNFVDSPKALRQNPLPSSNIVKCFLTVSTHNIHP